MTPNNRPYLIGLTGGIATGKSTVASILSQQGIPVLDADQLARTAVEPGSLALAAIRERFGAGVFHEDGSLHRRALGSLVFGDPGAKAWLEELIHPVVQERMRAGIQAWQGIPVGCLMIPLLFEAGLTSWVDSIWVVACSQERQRQRLAMRDDLTLDEINARLAAQWPLARKIPLAHGVIDNDGDPDALKPQVMAALAEVLQVCDFNRAGLG